ncbi:MAG: hypothetical protein A2Y33_09020 [Spirochaetes bacterium GWF1_51_8]|nr:MAG: hypothetical protein A2Y33_09020 [Spirochaetes bacterium GWF1_51_8]
MPESFIPKKKIQSQIMTGFILSSSVFGFTTVGSFFLMGLPFFIFSFWSINLLVIITQVIALVLCVTGLVRLDKEKERGKVLGILGIIMSILMVILLIVFFTMIVASPSL